MAVDCTIGRVSSLCPFSSAYNQRSFIGKKGRLQNSDLGSALRWWTTLLFIRFFTGLFGGQKPWKHFTMSVFYMQWYNVNFYILCPQQKSFFFKNRKILIANNFAFNHFLHELLWLKATKLFIMVILTHDFTGQRAQRAPIRCQKATSPLQELEWGAHS